MNLTSAQTMAIDLMRMHGVEASFRWTESMWRNGEALLATGRDELRLSATLTVHRSEQDVRNTILHEIAHLVSRDASHGDEFIKKARELGVTPNEGSKTLVMALAHRARK